MVYFFVQLQVRITQDAAPPSSQFRLARRSQSLFSMGGPSKGLTHHTQTPPPPPFF